MCEWFRLHGVILSAENDYGSGSQEVPLWLKPAQQS